MERIIVTCDTCNADLSSSSGSPSYRLRLQAEQMPMTGRQTGNMLTGNKIGNMFVLNALRVIPLLDRDYVFCGLTCLKNWLDKASSPPQPQTTIDGIEIDFSGWDKNMTLIGSDDV